MALLSRLQFVPSRQNLRRHDGFGIISKSMLTIWKLKDVALPATAFCSAYEAKGGAD